MKTFILNILKRISLPIINFIHKKAQCYFLKNYNPSDHRIIYKSILDIFVAHGEGFYYADIWSKYNNFLSSAIGLFSYGISHSVPVLYSENLRALFTEQQWDTITEWWNVYYGNNYGTEIPGNVKCLILPSADTIGLAPCDFSKYQNRKISIRKAPLTDQQKAIDYLVDSIGIPYDMWSLPAYLLGLKDDPFAGNCSQITYDGMKAGGLIIADRENPSPGDIEMCHPELIIFKN